MDPDSTPPFLLSVLLIRSRSLSAAVENEMSLHLARARQLFVVASALAVAVVAVSCAEDSGAPTRPSLRGMSRVIVPSLPPNQLPMLDDLLEEVNRRALGFGGMYRGANSELIVLVTPRADRALVESTIRDVFREMDWSRVPSIQFRDAQFEVGELQAVRRRIPQEAAASLIWSDFDEMNNRILLGVERGTDTSSVGFIMRALNAKNRMVAFEYSTRPKATSYLDSIHRPAVGGVAIDVWDSTRTYDRAWLTMGPNVKLSTDTSARYFLTNSHGTSTFAAVDHDSAYQPYQSTGLQALAVEVQDPAWRTDIANCPSYTVNQMCRYSDAALFKYLTPSNANFPFIAKDSTLSSTLGVNGSLYRVDSFVVNAEYSEANLLAADTVNKSFYLMKVGRTTGWTWGPITRSCVDLISHGGTLKCQYEVAAQADQGDSGSPVFLYTEYYLGQLRATLGGMLNSATAGRSFLFSSITGVRNDIANIVTH